VVSSELAVGIGDAVSFSFVFAPQVTTADLGQSLVADLSAPDFALLAAHFTNGVQGQANLPVILVGGGSSGLGIAEPIFFAAGDVAGLVPDAAGFTITRLEVEVHALTFDSPGTDPNGNGIWTDYTYELTWRVYGQAN
jgi:hypothetical protein